MRECYKQQIIKFIILNGWKKSDDDFVSYNKPNNFGIDINNNEVVIIADIGDIINFEINRTCIYTLLGYLIQTHAIGMDYKWSY